MRPGVLPQTYLADVCTYLRARWAPDGSRPGSVVVPVMFHSIVKGAQTPADPKDITVEQFQAFVQNARYLGFQTITTSQLIDFLDHNAPIPPLAMILIVDDRRPGLIDEHFMPVLLENDWTVTPAYIADPNSFQWAMDWMARLSESGRLDVQSHGYTGQLYMVDQTPVEQIRTEIISSTITLEQRFGQRPLAFIWPGGNFTSLAVQVARQDGYRLGFTAYSRGPLMFNWVPLGEEERAVNDPLMVLPRAWSSAVNANLYEALQISQQAQADAAQNYPREANYFKTYCGGELPPLSAILPITPTP